MDDELDLNGFDLPPLHDLARAPPPLSDGLTIIQGGAAVAKAASGSLVTVGSLPRSSVFVAPQSVAAAARQTAQSGGIVVLIPRNLDSTDVRLVLDGGAGVCRGSFCTGSGSAPVTEGVPISAANSSASFIYPAPARISIAVQSVGSKPFPLF